MCYELERVKSGKGWYEDIEAALRDNEAKYKACYAQLCKEQADNAKLREALRDCVEMLELFVGSDMNSEGAVDDQIREAKAALEGQ